MILTKSKSDIYAIRCFKNKARKNSDGLTKREAECFRKAAQHLVDYLTKEYKLK
jgi:hypothetical protein